MTNQFNQMVQGALGLQSLATQQQQAQMRERQWMQQEADRKAAEEQALLEQDKQAQLVDLRRAALSGDPVQMQELFATDPQQAAATFGFLDQLQGQDRQNALRNAGALKVALDQNPEQAKAFFEQNLANDPVFAGLADNFASGDYEGALSELAMGTARLDMGAYQDIFGGGETGSIGSYNPRDYTNESFAQFVQGGMRDPSVLERYTEKTINVGGVPHRLNPVTGSYEPVATTEQVAESEAEIAGARTAATEQAKTEAAAESPEAQARRTKQQQTQQQAISYVDNLLSKDLGNIAGWDQKVPLWSNAVSLFGQDALNDLRSLQNLLTLDNLSLMSGVLTDRDIQVLANAASGFDVSETGVPISQERLKELLQTIKDKMQGVNLDQSTESSEDSNVVDWNDWGS